jgi:hypothetical protein
MRMKACFGMKTKINFIQFLKFSHQDHNFSSLDFQSFLDEFDFNFDDLMSSCLRS